MEYAGRVTGETRGANSAGQLFQCSEASSNLSATNFQGNPETPTLGIAIQGPGAETSVRKRHCINGILADFECVVCTGRRAIVAVREA